jgi:hypothetical protein
MGDFCVVVSYLDGLSPLIPDMVYNGFLRRCYTLVAFFLTHEQYVSSDFLCHFDK